MSFDLLCLALGLGVGFGTGWLAYRGRQVVLRQHTEEERLALEKNCNALQIEAARLAERNRIVEDQRQSLQDELAQERQFNISLHAELSRERASRTHSEQRLEHQKSDFLQFQQKLSHEFRDVVQQVLEEESQALNDLNKSNLNHLLQPISDKLQDFKQKIEEQHYRETRELIVLHNKLANLESGRWRHNNGSPAPAPTTPVIPNPQYPAAANSLPASEEVLPELADESSPQATALEEALSETAMIAAAPPLDNATEGDAFQSFSPKQEVEIDNFLKRTLGRVQRKKPGE